MSNHNLEHKNTELKYIIINGFKETNLKMVDKITEMVVVEHIFHRCVSMCTLRWRLVKWRNGNQNGNRNGNWNGMEWKADFFVWLGL